jgi:dienelactone hydrolase
MQRYQVIKKIIMKAISVVLLILLFCFFSYNNLCYGQKPEITLDSYKTWQYVGGGELSEDGKYAFYIETLLPNENTILHVTTTNGKSIYSKAGVSNAKFTNDSKYVIGMLHDTLMIYGISHKKINFFTGIQSYELAKWGEEEKIFVKSPNGDLRILDYSGELLFQDVNVLNYKIMQHNMAMVVLKKDSLTNNTNLIWINVKNSKHNVIFSGNDVSNLITDKSGLQLSFMVAGSSNKIGYFRWGMRAAEMINVSTALKLTMGQYWSFSNDGSRVVFSLTEKDILNKKTSNPGLEIWNYEDSYLQSYYFGKNDIGVNIKENSYLATINFKTKEVVQVTKGDEIIINGTLDLHRNDYCIVESNANVRSTKWNNNRGRSYYLCTIKTGEMILLKENEVIPEYRWYISPAGKYLVYYDYNSKNYICYDIIAKIKRNITATIRSGLFRYDKLHSMENRPAGIVGWLKNDKALLLQGTFDLWRVDPTTNQPPINLTKGEGEKNKTIFSLALKTEEYIEKEKILLTAFDTRSKDYGFYIADLLGQKNLEKRWMGKCYMGDIYIGLRPHMLNQRKNGYLLRWEKANLAPNYYFSKDLTNFEIISDVRPESKWNWLTSELHTYKDSLGNELKGILYKPENFDSSKKYPIIFSVYELKSDYLNRYPRPDLAGAEFTLPWLVSNGYLVFMPDIKFIPKHAGDGAVLSVVAAANHLAQYKWADGIRIGISGHSTGGFVVNYIVTHCKRFKAALSGAGYSDMVSAATDLCGDGSSNQEFVKTGAYMMEVDLTDDKQAYIRNSPILSAANLVTPLMLLHNDSDQAVNYEHSRSFFMVLRNLQKPCWWLNYKGQDHQLINTDDRIDYNVRVKQFFDHYLKDEPMPDWMKEHY